MAIVAAAAAKWQIAFFFSFKKNNLELSKNQMEWQWM